MAIRPDFLLHALEADLLSQGLPSKGGDFWPGMTIQEAAAVSIRNSLLKKWEPDSSDAADTAALLKFLESNNRCKAWSLPAPMSSKQEMLLNGFKMAIDSFWFKNGYALIDSPEQAFEHARVGPGSNLEANAGDLYSKLFSSRLTCSNESVYNWYKHCISRLPEWANAEATRALEYGSARVVRGSRLSFVPKNDKISRCICTEPTLNTWFQLGVGTMLERRLKSRFGIDLATQQFKNRELARLGSITDGLSTIDLSSASDSISMRMLEWALPPLMFRMLQKFRTPVTEVPGLGAVELDMISTMGNGYTFPLQTALFACAVVACLHFRGIPERRNRSDSLWGVYGDDIICPSSVTSDVIELLNLLGFRINDDKSFVKGPFRESCGADFYLGTDIRGVYAKKLADPSDSFTLANLLVQFSTRTGISLEKTFRAVTGLLPRNLGAYVVPPWENIDSGIRVPWSIARRFVRSNRNRKTYNARVARPTRIRIMAEDIVVPRRHKRLSYNSSGLLISFVNGTINGASPKGNSCGYIGVREDNVKRTTKRRTTEMWYVIGEPTGRGKSLLMTSYGLSAPAEGSNPELDWDEWETILTSLSSEGG